MWIGNEGSRHGGVERDIMRIHGSHLAQFGDLAWHWGTRGYVKVRVVDGHLPAW